MQPNRDSFCGDVVLDSVNMTFRVENSILDQMCKKLLAKLLLFLSPKKKTVPIWRDIWFYTFFSSSIMFENVENKILCFFMILFDSL